MMGEFASTELVECFDRVIGKNLDDMEPQEVFHSFLGFTNV